MGKRAQSLVAICPFYKSESSQVIQCEGLQPNSAIHMAFGSPADKKQYAIRLCKSWDYGECPVAQMLNARYEDSGFRS